MGTDLALEQAHDGGKAPAGLRLAMSDSLCPYYYQTSVIIAIVIIAAP